MRLAPVLAGAAVTAAVLLAAREGPPRTHAPARTGDHAGRAVFVSMGCGSCHRLAAAGSTGPIGPDLDEVLPAHTRASLTAAIREPPAGGAMPEDFGTRMTPRELAALVEYLLGTRP
jgi:mono/diheme cytochrome c family protein